MQCNYCGAENPGNAVFCKKCGRRLDGMSLCSACGKLTPADGEFCINCGSNRNAPVYKMPLRFPIAKNGNEAAQPVRTEAAECERLRGAKSAGQVAAGTDSTAKPVYRSRASAVMGKISFLCAALSSLVGIIFVFLIGGTAHVSTGGVSAGGGPVQSIFYFFGDAYRAAVEADGTVSVSGMLGAVIGTVCCVAALVGTAICFALTVVRAIKILRKETQKGIFVPAAATYAAYICGTALFFLCIANKTTVAGTTMSIGASGATVAGIVLGAVFLVAAIVLHTFSQGIRGAVSEFVLHSVSKTVCIVFALVALGLLGGGAVSVGLESVNSAYGISTWFGMLANSNVYSVSLVLGIAVAAVSVAFCVFLLLSLSRLFDSVGEPADKRTRFHLLLAGICAAVAGILMIVSSAVYVNGMGQGVGYTVYAAPGAVVIVFGVLTVAGSIVYNILAKKFASRFTDAQGNDSENITPDAQES